MKAHVIDGKIVLDEPVEMPEGAELYVVQVPPEEDMTDEERAELNSMLEESFQELADGKTIDGATFLAELRARL